MDYGITLPSDFWVVRGSALQVFDYVGPMRVDYVADMPFDLLPQEIKVIVCLETAAEILREAGATEALAPGLDHLRRLYEVAAEDDRLGQLTFEEEGQ